MKTAPPKDTELSNYKEKLNKKMQDPEIYTAHNVDAEGQKKDKKKRSPDETHLKRYAKGLAPKKLAKHYKTARLNVL